MGGGIDGRRFRVGDSVCKITCEMGNRVGTVKKNLRAWKFVTAGGTLPIVSYFLLPNATSQNVEFAIIGVASVVLILLGVRLNSP